jgi:hypothetical protein
MGFEPMIPVFQRVKTIHALDRAATVIDTTAFVMGNLKVKLSLCLMS